VLKLREGAWVSAGAHQTEQLLHGHLAAIDESVRAYVLEGEGRAAERAADAVAALRELGCETTLVPTRHPVVDIVRFQRLTLANVVKDNHTVAGFPAADARDCQDTRDRPGPDPSR
jgi:fructoselysine-6-P-deglycase FrlB-like protein